MTRLLDYWEEEEERSNLMSFLLLDLLFFFLMEASRQLYSSWGLAHPELVYLYLLAFLLWNSWRGLSVFVKRPKFDAYWIWTGPQLLGHFILLIAALFWYWAWPALDRAILWATASLLFSALFLPLSNLIRQPRPALLMSPLWLYFLAHCFGLIGLSYTLLGWAKGGVFVDLGFILSAAAGALFFGLYYFNKKDFGYLLYYLGPLWTLTYYCYLSEEKAIVNYLDLIPLKELIH